MKSLAKLNLFLHVVGKRSDYHLLESLVVFLTDVYDIIMIKKSQVNKVIFNGPYKDGIIDEDNTVKRALELASRYISDKFHVTVTKNIPQGAGLGGGSSNAGCVLRYLIQKYQLDHEKIMRDAVKIGSDVPMFIYEQASYITGVGETVSPLKAPLPKMFILLVCPNRSINTALIYKAGGFKFNLARPKYPNGFCDLNQLLDLLRYTRNDLYGNSLKIFPGLENLLKALNSLDGCLFSRMTGSGSACFGIFADLKAAKFGMSSLQKKFPKYDIYISGVK